MYYLDWLYIIWNLHFIFLYLIHRLTIFMMAGFVKRAPRSIPPKLGKPKRTKIDFLIMFSWRGNQERKWWEKGRWVDCSQSPILSWDHWDIARLTVNGRNLDFQMCLGKGVGDYSCRGRGVRKIFFSLPPKLPPPPE